MGAVSGKDIDGKRGDAGHGFFVGFDFAGDEAAGVGIVAPGGMAVVAEDEFGADALDLACRLRSLRVAKVAEELHGAFETFSGDRIGYTARFEFEHVENLAA